MGSKCALEKADQGLSLDLDAGLKLETSLTFYYLRLQSSQASLASSLLDWCGWLMLFKRVRQDSTMIKEIKEIKKRKKVKQLNQVKQRP